MTKKKGPTKAYRILAGIRNDKLDQEYEAGDVAELPEPWNVAWLLEIGAIEPADLPFDEGLDDDMLLLAPDDGLNQGDSV